MNLMSNSFRLSPVTKLVLCFNPIALRMAKTLWSFGRSECSMVKGQREETSIDKKNTYDA